MNYKNSFHSANLVKKVIIQYPQGTILDNLTEQLMIIRPARADFL